MGYAHLDVTVEIGIKLKKNDNFKSENCLQTIDFTGFTKKSKNISTQILTVLKIGV